MTKRNQNIKNIFIMLQRGTNIMANQVKTPIQNYFEKVLYENLTFDIPPLWFFKSSRGIKKNCNKPLWLVWVWALGRGTFTSIAIGTWPVLNLISKIETEKNFRTLISITESVNDWMNLDRLYCNKTKRQYNHQTRH